MYSKQEYSAKLPDGSQSCFHLVFLCACPKSGPISGPVCEWLGLVVLVVTSRWRSFSQGLWVCAVPRSEGAETGTGGVPGDQGPGEQTATSESGQQQSVSL